MKPIAAVAALSSLVLAGCSGFLDPPQSIGDLNAGYRYVPIDPLPVSFSTDFSQCNKTGGGGDLLDALHNLAARVSVEQTSAEASVNAPIFGAAASGNGYRVTQDYIAYDEAPLRFELLPAGPGEADEVTPKRLRLLTGSDGPSNADNPVITVPVYVGVGLRLTANLTVRRGSVNLADLGSLSAAAKAEQIRGGLVAQALGVRGTKVDAILPLPAELNPTTIQHATVAMGAMKVLIADETSRRWPQVVGIHYPFDRVSMPMVNAIVSALAGKRLEWKPCETGMASLTAY